MKRVERKASDKKIKTDYFSWIDETYFQNFIDNASRRSLGKKAKMENVDELNKTLFYVYVYVIVT